MENTITIEMSTEQYKRLLLSEAMLLFGMVYFDRRGKDTVVYKRNIYSLTVTQPPNIGLTLIHLQKMERETPSTELINRNKRRYFKSLIETLPLNIDRYTIDEDGNGIALPTREVTENDTNILRYIRDGYEYDKEDNILYIVRNRDKLFGEAFTNVLKRSRGRWVDDFCKAFGYNIPKVVSDTIF